MVPERASGRVGIIPPSPTHQPTQAPYSPLGNTTGPPYSSYGARASKWASWHHSRQLTSSSSTILPLGQYPRPTPSRLPNRRPKVPRLAQTRLLLSANTPTFHLPFLCLLFTGRHSLTRGTILAEVPRVVAQLGGAQEELGGGPGGRGWGVNFAGDCGALFLFFLLVLLIVIVVLLLLTLVSTLLRQVGGSERDPQSEEWLVCGGREVGLLKASC